MSLNSLQTSCWGARPNATEDFKGLSTQQISERASRRNAHKAFENNNKLYGAHLSQHCVIQNYMLIRPPQRFLLSLSTVYRYHMIWRS